MFLRHIYCFKGELNSKKLWLVLFTLFSWQTVQSKVCAELLKETLLQPTFWQRYQIERQFAVKQKQPVADGSAFIKKHERLFAKLINTGQLTSNDVVFAQFFKDDQADYMLITKNSTELRLLRFQDNRITFLPSQASMGFQYHNVDPLVVSDWLAPSIRYLIRFHPQMTVEPLADKSLAHLTKIIEKQLPAESLLVLLPGARHSLQFHAA